MIYANDTCVCVVCVCIECGCTLHVYTQRLLCLWNMRQTQKDIGLIRELFHGPTTYQNLRVNVTGVYSSQMTFFNDSQKADCCCFNLGLKNKIIYLFPLVSSVLYAIKLEVANKWLWFWPQNCWVALLMLANSPTPAPSPTTPWQWGHVSIALFTWHLTPSLTYIIHLVSLTSATIACGLLYFLNCSKSTSYPTRFSYSMTSIPFPWRDGV